MYDQNNLKKIMEYENVGYFLNSTFFNILDCGMKVLQFFRGRLLSRDDSLCSDFSF